MNHNIFFTSDIHDDIKLTILTVGVWCVSNRYTVIRHHYRICLRTKILPEVTKKSR